MGTNYRSADQLRPAPALPETESEPRERTFFVRLRIRRGSGATGKPPRQGGCLCFRPLQSIKRETKFCLCLESNKVRARCSLAGELVRATNKGRPSLAGPPLFQSRPPDAFEIQPLSERPAVGEFRRLRTATRRAPPPRPPQGSKAPLTPFRFAFGSCTLFSPPLFTLTSETQHLLFSGKCGIII